jgi:hypothetical protein
LIMRFQPSLLIMRFQPPLDNGMNIRFVIYSSNNS